ncbi:MAG: acetate--CoA ligase family protein [Bacteroidales bacterium]|jgi:acetyltransferase|nr:acetate--CoA ligase family protein [Bacteroidales bacterium]
MVNEYIVNPRSIAVIGGSNHTGKPGGRLLKNILDGGYAGNLYVVNPNEDEVQAVKSYRSVELLPDVDLAVLAIPATACPAVVCLLAQTKNTRAFIVISAGFSETGPKGALLEKEMADAVNAVDGCLIGPNCTGVLTLHHSSIFTLPVPPLDAHGCDLISSSGATAVFILESGLSKGLRFSSVFSVGNSAQTGVEDILKYLDESFDPETSSRIKMIYVESIRDPDAFLFHATSLVNKGCRIAAIKAGVSKAGSRAAQSHTGALASSDSAVEALFRKAGIVRCNGREELNIVAAIFTLKELKGKRVAIITHAGGPAVMLTDALERGHIHIPSLEGPVADELKARLMPGSSVSNPVDMLATGTAQQLAVVIDYCEKRFDEIDAMMVIFGTPGLVRIFDAYEVLHEKIETCRKPIFPILPSVYTASEEVKSFMVKGHVSFSDEVTLGTAVAKVLNTPKPEPANPVLRGVDVPLIRKIIDRLDTGFAAPQEVRELLAAAGINVVPEFISADRQAVIKFVRTGEYPVVMKVVGPVHKSDMGGVVLNIKTEGHLAFEFDRMMKLPGVTAVMVQPMLSGRELFIGATYEERFGHVVLCGLGGIFVEVLEDVASGLAPLSHNEACSMIRSLRGYKIIHGARGQKGINEHKFAEIIVRLSTLVRFATEIKELDLNPLLATESDMVAVDARVRIEKK